MYIYPQKKLKTDTFYTNPFHFREMCDIDSEGSILWKQWYVKIMYSP